MQYYDERKLNHKIKIKQKIIIIIISYCIYVDRQLLIEIYFPICVMLVWFQSIYYKQKTKKNTLLRLINKNIFTEYNKTWKFKLKEKEKIKLYKRIDEVKRIK